MTAQADLFGAATISGLRTDNALISTDEEAELIARIDAEGLSPFRFQGWLGKRQTRSFGWRMTSTMAASRKPTRSPTGFKRFGSAPRCSRVLRRVRSSRRC
jgi:hypothetical protein